MKHLLSTIFIVVFSFVSFSQDKPPMIEPCKATYKDLPPIHGLKFGMSFAEVKAILPTLEGDEYTRTQRVNAHRIKNPAFSDIISIEFEFFNDKALLFYIFYKKSPSIDSIEKYRDSLSDRLKIPVEHWDIIEKTKKGGTVELNCYDFTLSAYLSEHTRYLLTRYVGKTAINNSKP